VFDVDHTISDQIVDLVPVDGIQVADLAHEVRAEPAVAKSHILHLLAAGEISFDPIRRPITDKTRVFPKGVISWDPFDSVWASSFYSMDGPIKWSANSPTTASLPKT
jgi:hypothetical protein